MGYPRIPLLGRHTASALLPPLLGGGMHRKQQVFQVCRPLLLLMFGKVRQLAQQMGAAHTMLTIIAIVALPAVMHRSPGEPWPDADGLQRSTAPLLVLGQMRQKTRTIHMHPVQFATQPHSCLVSVPSEIRHPHTACTNSTVRSSGPNSYW